MIPIEHPRSSRLRSSGLDPSRREGLFRLPISPRRVMGGVSVLLLLGLVACARNGGIDGTGAESAFERVPRLAVTEINRIGGDGGATALGEVLALTVDAEGLVHVVESGTRTVRVFSPDGELSHELGGADDPVTFSRPEDIGRDGDRVWVFDRVRYQLTRFAGRTLVDQSQFSGFDIPGDEFPYVTAGPVPGGHGRGVALVLPDMDGGRADIVRPVVRVTHEGQVVDTLWSQRVGNEAVEIEWFGGGGATAGPQPFTPDPVRAFSWSDSALVEVVHRTEPVPLMTVQKRKLEGGLLFESEVPFVPSPLTDAEVEGALDLLAAGWRGRVETDEEIRTLFRRALVVPAVRRPYQHVIASHDGYTWVRLTPTASDGGLGPVPPHAVGVPVDQLGGDASGSRWIVFSPSGELTGRVMLPAHFLPMWIQGSRVMGVQVDAGGIHRIVELRVD